MKKKQNKPYEPKVRVLNDVGRRKAVMREYLRRKLAHLLPGIPYSVLQEVHAESIDAAVDILMNRHRKGQ